ncbi:hypothetical protein [Leucobacter sp. UCD-THU]|uniref:hypothetical protein n=1 Tax=Leucobacter sp. UCD-THU TaxID=1292023 RepID=UPI001268B0B2|nr:hypothetical protein [Leucobacter sp. UCD-THU]
MDLSSESYVDSMPCDPDLLEELGRVVWAAARLHFGIRDAINRIVGESSDAPFGTTLGGALSQLTGEAKTAGRLDIIEWVETIGRPAKNKRDGVLHAVTFTAEDNQQAIGAPSSEKGPHRYGVAELREVSYQLIHASRTLPR